MSYLPLLIVLLTVGCIGESSTLEVPAAPARSHLTRLYPPAGFDSLAPQLWVGAESVYLSWLEPRDGGGHRLRAAKLRGDVWDTPFEVVSGADFFANWADVPAVVEAPDGTLVAHWLEKLGEATYAYGVQLARSDDGGETWTRLGLLHEDASETEHGFVAWQALDDALQAVWLDGRETAAGGAMQLRTARVTRDGPSPSAIIDDSVCDCCPTALARAQDGPIAAYRARRVGEIRDVAVSRAAGDGEKSDRGKGWDREKGWHPPKTVYEDRWHIPGCPVNGPAIDAAGRRVALAWFTAAGGEARVQVAFSDDGGASFDDPVVLDDQAPLGRVGLVLAGDDAWVSWLATRDGRGEIRLQRVARDGTRAPAIVVGSTSAARAAGIPRLARDGDRLLVAWVEDRDPAVLRVTTLPIDQTAL